MPPDIPYIKTPEHLQNSNTDLKLALPTLHPWVFSDIKHSNRRAKDRLTLLMLERREREKNTQQSGHRESIHDEKTHGNLQILLH